MDAGQAAASPAKACKPAAAFRPAAALLLRRAAGGRIRARARNHAAEAAAAAAGDQIDPAKRVRDGGREAAGLSNGGSLVSTAGPARVRTAASRTAAITPYARTACIRPARTRAATIVAAAAAEVTTAAVTAATGAAAAVDTSGAANMGARMKAPVRGPRRVGSNRQAQPVPHRHIKEHRERQTDEE